jgi:hypothetical protein
VRTHQLRTLPLLLIAAGGLVVGLAVPAAAHEAGSLINGKSIAIQSLPGNRLKVNTVTGRQVKESTLGTVPRAKVANSLPPLKWHRITTFLNGWGPYPDDLPLPGYALDVQGLVHLRGYISGGAVGETAFTLPASVTGPSGGVYFPVVCKGPSVGTMNIFEETVEVDPAVSGDNCGAFTSLEGLTYPAK